MTTPWVACPLLIKKGISFCFLIWFAKFFNVYDFFGYKPYESIISRLPTFFHACSWFCVQVVQRKYACAHTTLCGHADSTPEFVAQWYHDRGYNFLVLSEHNKFIDPNTVKLKGEIRMIFYCFLGRGDGPIHSTAMNISRLVLLNLRTRIVRKLFKIMWMKPGKRVGRSFLIIQIMGGVCRLMRFHRSIISTCSNCIMLIQECIVLGMRTSSKPGAGLGRLVGKENDYLRSFIG